jgi:hypothetical protein
MNTLEQAYLFIRENGAAFWRLMVRYDGRSEFTKLFSYEPTDDPEVNKIEDSINQLSRKLSFQNYPTAEYQLWVKTAKTAGKETEFGPFIFRNNGSVQNQHGTAIQGLGSVSMPGSNFDFLGNITSVFESKLALAVEKAKHDVELINQKNELEKERAEIAKIKSELKEKEERFKSHSLATTDGVLKAGKLFFDSFVPPGSGKNLAQEMVNGLTGNNTPAMVEPASENKLGNQKPHQEEVEEETEEEKFISAIAENIHKNINDRKKLEALGFLVNEIIKSPGMLDSYVVKIEEAKIRNTAKRNELAQEQTENPET